MQWNEFFEQKIVLRCSYFFPKIMHVASSAARENLSGSALDFSRVFE